MTFYLQDDYLFINRRLINFAGTVTGKNLNGSQADNN